MHPGTTLAITLLGKDSQYEVVFVKKLQCTHRQCSIFTLENSVDSVCCYKKVFRGHVLQKASQQCECSYFEGTEEDKHT